jgi:hypothetical protein
MVTDVTVVENKTSRIKLMLFMQIIFNMQQKQSALHLYIHFLCTTYYG